jgi:hypothetical protein
VSALSAPVVLDDIPLRIDPAEVRAFHAYKEGRDSARVDAARIDEAIAAVARVMRPRAVYRSVPVAASERDRLVLAGGTRLHIPGIGEHWGPIETVAPALVTIGDGIEAVIRERRARSDQASATLLDSAASAAVECLAEWLNDHLCQVGVAAGRRVTNRISPGLAGWALAEQATLLALLPASAVGVTPSADGTLAPAKTISLVAGGGPAARVDHYFVQCRRCWAEGCPARRAPAATTVAWV